MRPNEAGMLTKIRSLFLIRSAAGWRKSPRTTDACGRAEVPARRFPRPLAHALGLSFYGFDFRVHGHQPEETEIKHGEEPRHDDVFAFSRLQAQIAQRPRNEIANIVRATRESEPL